MEYVPIECTECHARHEVCMYNPPPPSRGQAWCLECEAETVHVPA